MKIFSRGILLFVFAVILFGSCKNGGNTDSSVKSMLVGKWKIIKITTEEDYADATGAPDDNGVVVTLNADGTGNSSSVSGGSAFKWALANNSTYLNITDSVSSQVVALLLTKTSSSSFTVKDTSTHPAQWEVFKKQNDK